MEATAYPKDKSEEKAHSAAETDRKAKCLYPCNPLKLLVGGKSMAKMIAVVVVVAMVGAAFSGCISNESAKSVEEPQESERTPYNETYYNETYSFEKSFTGGWEGASYAGTFPVMSKNAIQILAEMTYTDQLPVDSCLYIRIRDPNGNNYDSEKDGGSYERIKITDRSIIRDNVGDWDVYMRVGGQVAKVNYKISIAVFYEGREEKIQQISESSTKNGTLPLIDLKNKPRVVVAVIDTGINPYHEIFSRPGMTMHPSEYIDGFPEDVKMLNLTFNGTYEECRKSDNQIWNSIKVGALYTIPETNIIGAVCIDQRAKPPEEASIIDEGGHGTATASLIVKNCPDALIVMVQWKYGALGSAVKWAAEQPWIDILSVSMGYPANLPPIYDDSWKEIMAAHKTGKQIFFGAGNDPTLSITDPFSGPPCVISVGGVENDTHGETVMASKAIDFVSEFTTRVAKHNDRKGEYTSMGTSFACPIAAGTAAQILLNLRNAVNYTGSISEGSLVIGSGGGILSDGRITSSEFRELLNRTAIYWNTTDYSVQINSNPYGITAPILPAPWVQMGWGYLNWEVVSTATEVALGLKTPPEKPLAEEYMSSMQALRAAYWALIDTIRGTQ